MKKFLVLVLALVMTAATGALAADNATVTVTASITGTCTFTTNTATLAFGVLDPVLAPAATTNTGANPLRFTCTNNTSYTITDVGAGAGSLSNTIDNIAYTYALGIPLLGTAGIAPIDLPLTADIAAGAYAGFSAGNYSDTITISIAP